MNGRSCSLNVVRCQSCQKLHEDLSSFKAVVRKELDSMGLKITNIEHKSLATESKLKELEEEIRHLKMEPIHQSNTQKAVRNNTAVIGSKEFRESEGMGLEPM